MLLPHWNHHPLSQSLLHPAHLGLTGIRYLSQECCLDETHFMNIYTFDSQETGTQAALSVADATLREIYNNTDSSSSHDSPSDVQIHNVEVNESSSDVPSSCSSHSSGGEASANSSHSANTDQPSGVNSSSGSDSESDNQQSEGENEQVGQETDNDDMSDNGEDNDESGDEECLDYVR